jgi:Ribbon-helix-helix protein, copG family
MTRNVNALLEDAQYERLRRAAFETRRPMTDILREALEDWLNLHEGGEGDSSE